MIHSAIEDNWMRVQIMHTAAHSIYLETHDSEYRHRKLNGGDCFPFHAIEFKTIQKESSIAGMVMAWSVVFLECIVNHALAEKLHDKSQIITAIENPKKITAKIEALKNYHTGLVHKLAILSENFDISQQLASRVSEVSSIRNKVVHDKPFELVNYGNGEVEVSHFLNRGSGECEEYVYDDLRWFYEKCDDIKEYIIKLVAVSDMWMDIDKISFGDLLRPGNDNRKI